MVSEELALDVGETLQLQFLPEGKNARHYVKVIGYLPGQSLLVSAPLVHGKVMLVREGQPVAVRLMSGKEVVAFEVSVLRSCGRPYPYLHLSYPKDMQSITVRKAHRVNFNISAVAKDCSLSSPDKNSYPVLISDMSTSGALFAAQRAIGAVKGIIAIDMPVSLANESETMHLVALVRNIRERVNPETQQTEYLHGVEFQFADRQESIKLHAVVYEKIANDHYNE